jgi:transcriptional regulator with XRE-family HTH domain
MDERDAVRRSRAAFSGRVEEEIE